MKFILLLFLFPVYCFARIDVAFLELRTYDGKVIQLEPNGQFAHIAISYQNKWLHAHPYRGVEIISTEALQKIGAIKTIITISKKNSLNESVVKSFLNTPYDSSFTWGNDKLYCSELVAKLLNIQPQAMKFEASFWPQKFKNLRGQFGISPDDIFNFLKNRGYQSHDIKNQCSKLF
ncbi:MAG: YiiX/YebB-like N1pC/P60 family cysteine hydrolase [Bdellovibrionota bacterium]